MNVYRQIKALSPVLLALMCFVLVGMIVNGHSLPRLGQAIFVGMLGLTAALDGLSIARGKS